MRDEKEERKKQARSNKQTRQSNTAHGILGTRQSYNSLAVELIQSLEVAVSSVRGLLQRKQLIIDVFLPERSGEG